MDTNVIGRIMFIGEKEPDRPKITRIVVLDLTEESHGNAVGIGLADYTTQKLVNKLDSRITSTNAITAMTPEKGRLPLALATEREAIDAALNTIGAVGPEKARVIHIKNTLQMGELDISQSFLEETKERADLRVLNELGSLTFDREGRLIHTWHEAK
jgi:hypothetical protein